LPAAAVNGGPQGGCSWPGLQAGVVG